MFDLDVSKLAVIGAVALVVIGPEKMPRVARTIGTMLGKAQRYVSDVKAEVNRAMEMEDLKKMKETMESAARDVQSSVQTTATEFEQSWNEATSGLEQAATGRAGRCHHRQRRLPYLGKIHFHWLGHGLAAWQKKSKAGGHSKGQSQSTHHSCPSFCSIWSEVWIALEFIS